MKVLAMARTLLRGEGQALVLRDTTTDPVTYQVIYSGNAMSFTGIDQGAFGNISAGEEPSLAGAAMHTHKPVRTPVRTHACTQRHACTHRR